jgi:hypothetical protein
MWTDALPEDLRNLDCCLEVEVHHPAIADYYIYQWYIAAVCTYQEHVLPCTFCARKMIQRGGVRLPLLHEASVRGCRASDLRLPHPLCDLHHSFQPHLHHAANLRDRAMAEVQLNDGVGNM